MDYEQSKYKKTTPAIAGTSVSDPKAGWNHVTVVDYQTGRNWDFNNAYGEEDAPVPADIAARRYRALGSPAVGENQQPVKPGNQDY